MHLPVFSHRLDRQLWQFVAPTTVAICSVLAASGLANLVSEVVLPEQAMAAPAPIASRHATPNLQHSKDATQLLARNMFCRECGPEEGITEEAAEFGKPTKLPLRLIATNISSRDSRSFASVLNTESLKQGAYRLGENIPDAGIVRRIGPNFVEFRVEGVDRVERVHFDSGNAKAVAISATRAAASRGGGAFADAFVRAISDTHFEVDRELIGKVRGNPKLAGARAFPQHNNGVMTGVRVSAVQRKGLAHSMGLRNGDTIRAANGVKLTSIEAGLELMGQLATRDHWSFTVERRGKPMQLVIDLQ